jgi:TalC/MipB family fructose-6-phosphate aldolase
MQLWLDTADITAIRDAQESGLLTGITTNPSILAATQQAPKEVIQQILTAQTGLLAVQIIANTVPEMIQQARHLYQINSRIVVKVPASPEGYQVMVQLAHAKIPVMATAIFTPQQVLLSGLANATYAAPYLNHIAEQQGDYIEPLKAMLDIIRQQHLNTKIIAASIKNVEQVIQCALLGTHAITLPSVVWKQLFALQPATSSALTGFTRHWDGVLKAEELFH